MMDVVSISEGTTLDKGAFQESNIASMTIKGKIKLPKTSNVFDKAKVETLTLIDVDFSDNVNAVNPTVVNLNILQEDNDNIILGNTPSKSGAKKCYIDANIQKPKSVSPFSNSDYLTELSFGPKVKVIFETMFYSSPKISVVKLSDGLEEIEHSAFSDCNGIVHVECPAALPPLCAPTAFTDMVYKSAELQVPAESKDSYAAAAVGAFSKRYRECRGLRILMSGKRAE